MTRKQRLIAWSAARDFLDIIWIGQIPVLGQALSLPIWIMHFSYAGKAALFTLLEMMPGVGLFPVFTTAACCYPDFDKPAGSDAPAPTLVGHVSVPVLPSLQQSVPILDTKRISDSSGDAGTVRRVRQVESYEVVE